MKKLFLALMMFAPMATFAQKFGHVNSQEIIQAMPEYTTARNEVDALQKQYENDLKLMQDELTKKSAAYDSTRATLPENIRQRREQELQELYQRIQQSYQDNQRSLQETSQQKMQAISDKMLGVIKEIGAEGGYVYIMDVAAGIPYISTTLSTDVTAQIKQKLGLQ